MILLDLPLLWGVLAFAAMVALCARRPLSKPPRNPLIFRKANRARSGKRAP